MGLAMGAALAAGLWLSPAAAQDAPAASPPPAADDGFGADATVFRGAGYVLAVTPGGPGAYALQAEVEPGARSAALGGRSASAEVALDCGLRQAVVREVRVFPQPRLQGEGRTLKPSNWFRASPVDLFDLTQALCGDAPTHALPAAPVAQAAPERRARAQAAALRPQITTRAVAPAPVEVPAERGTHWVQLGAFGSEAAAEAGWARLRAAAPALAAEGRRIEPVERGGARLYRLLAGPYASAEAAQSACAAARQAGAACLMR